MDLSFLNMIDTPDTYTGKANRYYRVKATEDGLEDFDLAQAIVDTFAFAAYGGLDLSAPSPTPAIGAAWVPIEFDATTVATPKNLTVSTANNSILVPLDGVYRVSISLGFTHDELNAGRKFEVRAWNITDGIALSPHPIRGYTGRNTPGSNFNWAGHFEITEALKNREIRLEIRTDDVYIIDEWDVSTWAVDSVSEWRGPFAE